MFGSFILKKHYHIYMLFSEAMEEFSEEDIWGGFNDAETKELGLGENRYSVVAVCRSRGSKLEGNSNTSKRSVRIPRRELCHEENSKRILRYRSKPVNIPDSSQMLWKERKNEINGWRRSHERVDDYGNEDGDGRDFEWIPPHELVARQLAQSEIPEMSVYEGIGRTLKGRDLSQVRTAVLTRTGFIE